MVESIKIICKLTNVQLAVKFNEGATLKRLGIKNFDKDELPHELLDKLLN